MDKEPRAGSTVGWSRHGGTTHGKMVRRPPGRPRSPGNPVSIAETAKGKRGA